ncbi:hypothetical protein V1264_024990 [Littorina saxatilis]|uniref:Uncharacterized protein n=1 Tax=Littorina saxatilis TaxID=31220 RepID=A0AAN9AL15_9CAEN
MVDSHSFVNMFFVFAAVLQISSLVHCLPVQSGDLDEAAAYSELGWKLSQENGGDMSKRSFDSISHTGSDLADFDFGDSSVGRRLEDNVRAAFSAIAASIAGSILASDLVFTDVY